MKILRGVGLIAMDNNFVTADSSDPYCDVYLNKVKLGRTPVISQTLNPIYGGPKSTFTFNVESSDEMIITIKIFDFDNLKDDDPMGEIKFNVRDLLLQIESGSGYPNVWIPVARVDGCEGEDDLGKLQVRLLRISKNRSFSYKEIEVPTNLSIGPKLKADGVKNSKSHIQEILSSARAPVTLHVYDVGHNENVRRINKITSATGSGGIFHGAIEIYGKEFSFGGSKRNYTGVFDCKPRQCPMHEYRESIYLGDCNLSRHQVLEIIKKMMPEWMAPTYDVLRKNCCFFSREFSIELGVGDIPSWVYSLANVGAKVDNMINHTDEKVKEAEERRRKRKEQDEEKKKQNEATYVNPAISEEKDAELDHRDQDMREISLDVIMAIRLQRALRFRKANRQLLQQESYHVKQTRKASVNDYDGCGFEINI